MEGAPVFRTGGLSPQAIEQLVVGVTDRKDEPLSPSSSHLTLPSVNPSGLPVRAV